MKRGLYPRFLWLALTALLLMACNGKGKQGAGTLGSAAKPPPFPQGFTPPPPLPEPPPPEQGKPGLVYLQKLHGPIGEPWHSFLENCRLRLPPDHPLNHRALETRLDVTINKKGELNSVTAVTTSGNQDFDQAAAEIVHDAAPFPEPPPDLISDDDLVHVSWLFARDQRQAGIATAELEVVTWPAKRAVPKFLTAGDVTTAARRLAREAAAAGSGQQAGHVELGNALAVAVIREALRSQEPAVQRVAAAAVASAKVLAAAPELRAIIDSSVDIEVRGEAIAAVGAIGDQGAAQVLVGVLEMAKGSGVGGKADNSVAAAHALAAIGRRDVAESTIMSWLKVEDSESRWAALVVLSEFPMAAALPILVAMLEDPAQPRQMRMAACAAIGASTGNVAAATGMKVLVKHLSETDAALRAACARAVARAARAGVKNRLAYWKLVDLIKKDRDERVRAAAVLAAAHLEPGRFHDEIYLLHREKSPVVLAALAQGLARVPHALALAKLQALLAHADPTVRREAVTSLLTHPDGRARKALARLVDDADPEVRLTAIAAVTDPATLNRLLEDPSIEVRARAFASLVRVRGKPATLVQMAQGIAQAQPGSGERAHWAVAWFLP